MNKERLQEIKDSVEFQKEILEAHNMNTLCVDEEQELLEEIERLQEELKYTIPIVEHNQTIQSNINSYNKLAEYSKELEDRIDELNNIINELEKYSENMIGEYNEAIEEAVDNIDKFNLLGARSSYHTISNKIKELKGSDKE